jgi:hypothetical protein
MFRHPFAWGLRPSVSEHRFVAYDLCYLEVHRGRRGGRRRFGRCRLEGVGGLSGLFIGEVEGEMQVEDLQQELAAACRRLVALRCVSQVS